MIISYVHPLDLTHTRIPVDTDKDFVRFVVNTSGYVESNKFLVSLWNQVNTQICPDHCIDRAPWAYFPGKFVGKRSTVSVLGFCQTIMGELYFALEYRKKGDIDTLLVMRPMSKLKNKEVDKLRFLIDSAIVNIDKTNSFLCKANILTHMQNMRFAEYSANNFCITQSDKDSIINFHVNAIDKFEAEQLALERLYEICAILTIETNIHCSFDEFSVKENELLPKNKTSGGFINDYIDHYPTNDRGEICISQYAYNFINEKIFSIGRFEKRGEIERFFISACKHVQIGIEAELNMGNIAVASTPFVSFVLSNTGQRYKEEYMTSALMSYLSAIECATVAGANKKKCEKCGATIYKIASRVRDLSTEFLGDNLGMVFHKLYEYRSKFLHAGRMASDANVVRTIPLLSESSEIGVKAYGNVVVKVSGNICSFHVSNIREWTTYILRCYYQKRILGRTVFADVFNATPSDLPIIVSAISPEGSEHMKNIFIKKNTLRYKILQFNTHIVNILRRFRHRLKNNIE